jgi:hypothetical protein
MPQQINLSIRDALLSEVKAQDPSNHPNPAGQQTLQQRPILYAVQNKMGLGHDEAILTEWGELFRTGLLAWGLDISNPDPPFFHLTDRGRKALERATRDPSNPLGYLKHLASIARINPIAMSYLTEGLDCYVSGLFKAAAVMVGASAESLIIDLRDFTVAKLTALSQTPHKNLIDWRIKTIFDALQGLFEKNKLKFSHELRESFDQCWSPFVYQIRVARNDAGHPTSIEPVTSDRAHASLLVFPELAKLTNSLAAWVDKDLV